MTSVVLDASIVVSWLLSDESDAYAESVLKAMKGIESYSPAHLGFEVANSLSMAVRRSRLTLAEALSLPAVLASFSIRCEPPPTQSTLQAIVDLAHRESLTAYDSAYIELARRISAPLATIDAKQGAAALKAGVPIFKP